MAVCKQKISNTENCKREEYKDGLCILHHHSNDKSDIIFRRIIRDDIYRGFYNFSYMISYDGFDFDGLKIDADAHFIFNNSLFFAPFKIKNFSLNASLELFDVNFDSGFFINMSNIYKDIVIKDSKFNMDFDLSLSNIHSLDIDNVYVNCNCSIINSDIIDKLYFNHIHFKNNLIFINSSFRGDVIFKNIIIDGDADFRNIVFYKTLKFENVEIKGRTIPQEMTHNKNIDFVNVLINGKVIENNHK